MLPSFLSSNRFSAFLFALLFVGDLGLYQLGFAGRLSLAGNSNPGNWMYGYIVCKFFLFSFLLSIASKKKQILLAFFNALFSGTFVYLVAVGEAIFQIRADIFLIAYVLKNISYLWSDANVFWNNIHFSYFLLGLIFYAIIHAFFWSKTKFEFSEIWIKRIQIALFTIITGCLLFSYNESMLNFSTLKKKEQNINSEKSKSNVSVVIFLLESVNHKYFPQEKFLQEIKKDFPNTQEISYFYVPTPHSSFSIYSLLTGKYVQGGTRPAFTKDNPSDSLGNLFKSKYFFYTQPAEVDSIDDMVKYFGLKLRDKRFYKKKYNYEEFSWGVDDLALLDQAKETIPEEKDSFLHIYGFSNSHSPYFCLNDPVQKDPLLRYKCAIEYDLSLISRIVHSYPVSNKIIFILTSDHGESFGEHGFLKHDFSLFNEEVRVPFFIFSNFLIPTVNQYASILDIYPSIAEFSNTPSQDSQGKSFFSNNSKFSLRLKVWNSNQAKGLIEGQKKWIWEINRNTLWEMNLDDSEIQVVNNPTILEKIKTFAW